MSLPISKLRPSYTPPSIMAVGDLTVWLGCIITGCAVVSASTATGFVNNNGSFRPPTESTPVNWSPKTLSVTPTAVPNLVYICPRGFSANGWNVTNFFRPYLFYWELSYSLDPSTDFRAWITQFKSPKKHFGAWIRIFQPKLQNIKTCILSKLMHRFQRNFPQWWRAPNALHWLVQTCA